MRTPPVFKKLKDSVLGKNYDLSVALISPAAMRRAMKYKASVPKKVSNVLSFPLSKNSGEILICPNAAKPYSIDYLFIHGLLHIKGFKHGAIMENAEERLLKRFKLCKEQSPVSTSGPTRSRSLSRAKRQTRAGRRRS